MKLTRSLILKALLLCLFAFYATSAEAKHTNCKAALPTLAPLVVQEAQKQKVSPVLVMALIEVESQCNPRAVSRMNARGLMQVMPRYHWKRIAGRDMFKPEVNLEVGISVLKYYMGRTKTVAGALRMYSGNTPGYHSKVARAMRKYINSPYLRMT